MTTPADAIPAESTAPVSTLAADWLETSGHVNDPVRVALEELHAGVPDGCLSLHRTPRGVEGVFVGLRNGECYLDAADELGVVSLLRLSPFRSRKFKSIVFTEHVKDWVLTDLEPRLSPRAPQRMPVFACTAVSGGSQGRWATSAELESMRSMTGWEDLRPGGPLSGTSRFAVAERKGQISGAFEVRTASHLAVIQAVLVSNEKTARELLRFSVAGLFAQHEAVHAIAGQPSGVDYELFSSCGCKLIGYCFRAELH